MPIVPKRVGFAPHCCGWPIDMLNFPGLVYLDPVAQGNLGWPADTITDGPPDIESIAEALRGPYGKCVFESPNDVVDHQVLV